MKQAPEHQNEAQRLKALLDLEILDTEDEAVFDELTELASHICGTPISLISLVDHKRQWFKSKVGLDAAETPKEIAFCSHAILQDDVFEVPNAMEDERFHDNPLVTGNPDIRFYAGAPLVTQSGFPIGTLCVIDQEPKHLSEQQKRSLEILSHQVIGQLELRIKYKQLERMNLEREKVFSIIGHDLRSPFSGILGASKMLLKQDFSKPELIKKMANGILTSSLQVYQVLDELIQWSQQRMGVKPVGKKVNGLSPMVQDCISLLEEAIEEKQLQVENQVPPNLNVSVDAAIFKTVMRNILANAIKYSPDQGRIIINASDNQERYEISIQDQGSGIAPETIDHLFKHVVKSQKDMNGQVGSGMGLSLCADLLASQHGKIWVDDTYKNGTRIMLSFEKSAPDISIEEN